MSNNARDVADGEIGSAQYFQALAARCEPEVRMNPVLLKPERHMASQLILLGQRNDMLSRIDWRSCAAHLWPVICESLNATRDSHELVIIEGADLLILLGSKMWPWTSHGCVSLISHLQSARTSQPTSRRVRYAGPADAGRCGARSAWCRGRGHWA